MAHLRATKIVARKWASELRVDRRTVNEVETVSAAGSMLWRCRLDETDVMVVTPVICARWQDCSESFGLIPDKFAAMVTENGHDESSVRQIR